MKDLVESNLVFRCVAGSHSYGTAVASSDRDTRGIFIAPPEYQLSCIQSVDQVEDKQTDTVHYNLGKFINLAANCNPNIIELLYTDDKNIIFIDEHFLKIREQAHLFLSKKAMHTFSGYAVSQLHRIKGHNKWISNPKPVEAPKLSSYCQFVSSSGNIVREESKILEIAKTCFLAETFGSSKFRVYESDKFFEDKLGFFDDKENQPKYVSIDESQLSQKATFKGFLLINIDEFKANHRQWKEYWEWKNNRNKSRSELEEKFGFDSKHAMHLVRLMKMCEEILTLGKVIVFRPDAEELIGIRNGNLKYDELIKWVDEMQIRIKEAYDKSTLQFSANYKRIDEIYRETVFSYWKKKGLI